MTMITILDTGYSRQYHSFCHNEKEGLPFYLIRLQVEGQCKVYVKDHYETVWPGDLLLFKPGESYEILVETAQSDNRSNTCLSSDYYICCQGEWLDEWWNRNERLTKTNIPIDVGIVSLWQCLITQLHILQFNTNEITDHLLQSICLFIDRTSQLANKRLPTSSHSYVAYQIKCFIEQHATSRFLLEDVAEYVGFSVSTVVHLFKKTYNQTIIEYMNQTRLSIACERIRYSKMNLELIAESVGFQSYTYFYRAFHARFGISPRQYRNNK